jgi:glycosyltransferase involved in cell wall biosynthesis
VIEQKLKQKPYQVLHVNQPQGYLTAKALAKRRTVFIHRSHGFELRVERDLKPWKRRFDRDDRPLSRRLMSKVLAPALAYHSREIARYADGHIVSASQCRDFLREEMGVPAERIALIPQAAPQPFLEQPAPPLSTERLRRILYVGQFAFIKAPILLAAVINRLAAADEAIEFTWICSRVHHKEVRAMLEPVARQRVQLMDWVAQDDLMRAYDDHGIFLFPSFFEGFGKAFLEAMSRGMCVVGADNGGARDIIVNGVSGILTQTGDAEAMASACLRLLRDSEAAGKISMAAAKTARLYSWERVARETVAFYKKRIEAKATQLSK